jgi:hypothetical protein
MTWMEIKHRFLQGYEDNRSEDTTVSEILRAATI